jgi:hypothetical protein
MQLPSEACDAGAKPAWIGYIAVDDVDAAAARVVAAGGNLHREIMDIPNVGRIAMVSDPQGAALMLMTPTGQDQPAPPPMTPKHIGWHELHTSDWEAAFRFYSEQFGFAKDEAMDMGPMGIYQLFSAGGGDPIGGMMNSPQVPRPAWLYYFIVADFDAAVERIGAAGGKVLNGPMEVPGGAWVVQAIDPQGAMFAIVGMRG